MTTTHESTMQPSGMNVEQEQEGGSTKWQGGIHYEGSQRNDSDDILQRPKNTHGRKIMYNTKRPRSYSKIQKREDPV